MTQKIVSFTVSELLAATDDAQDCLNRACSGRRTKYRVRGCCQVDSTVYVVLAPLAAGQALESYVLATVEDTSSAGFPSMLAERWAAGFDTLGVICAGDAYLALYAQPGKLRS